MSYSIAESDKDTFVRLMRWFDNKNQPDVNLEEQLNTRPSTRNFASRAYLVQAIGKNETGLAIELARSTVIPTFKIDLLSSYFILTYTLNITCSNPLISATLTLTESTSALELNTALQSIGINEDEISIGLSSMAYLGLVNNDRNSETYGSYINEFQDVNCYCHLISFLGRFINSDINLSIENVLIPGELNLNMAVVNKTYDLWTGNLIYVTDVLDLPNPNPLTPGTKVIVNPFEDVEYGIVAAIQKNFMTGI